MLDLISLPRWDPKRSTKPRYASAPAGSARVRHLTSPIATSRRRWVLTCLAALSALPLGCRDVATVLAGVDDARRSTAELRVQFSKAVDASNRAVMADTDESSLAFVREAEQATQQAARAAASLVGLLRSLGFSTESQILREFEAQFSEYQKLDRRILELAAENTNLKAQALSYGAASQAASRFRDALEATAASFPSGQRCRVDAPLAQALLAVREIQILHAPHIAERDAHQMARLEREMAELQIKAKSRLKSLGEGAPSNVRRALDDALAALDEFKTTSERIVALSRRNTNLASLDLALRERPPLVSACDDRLRMLQQLLANRNSKATR